MKYSGGSNMSAEESTSEVNGLQNEWRKCVSESIQSLVTRFKDIHSDKERLALCRNALRQDPGFIEIIKRIKCKIEANNGNAPEIREVDSSENRSQKKVEMELPTVAKDKHPKISNGSALIQLNCSKSQGRYLEASGDIKAGDVLILEKPYAAVLVSCNEITHCSHCFELLKENFSFCGVCNQARYCCIECQTNAWESYHKHECSLCPLLEMLEISSHLALRLLLVTEPEKLLDFIQKKTKVNSEGCRDPSCPDTNIIPGCTADGAYSADYGCVHSLVTNTELQPIVALVSFALDAALITEVTFNHIYGKHNQVAFSDTPVTDHGITEDIMGCLLLHHMQQMPCNIHAVTAIVSVSEQAGVSSKEQRRIAAGIYPTASLMNHACDPDVIVSFIGRTLVVRATHNIKPGEEIAHCYGPSASRMSREVRQSLLQKQYFFNCNCSACKSDKDLEEQYIYEASFKCPKCSSAVNVRRKDDENPGRCQNSKCGLVKDFSSEIDVIKEAQKLFSSVITSLEEGRGEVRGCLDNLKECLKKRQNALQKYDKDVAETHDALARCHASLGDFRQAAFHCEQSTESVRRRFGTESVEYAHELHKFAQLLFNGRQTRKAWPVIENGIRLLSIHYGSQYSDVGELQTMKKTLKNFLEGKT